MVEDYNHDIHNSQVRRHNKGNVTQTAFNDCKDTAENYEGKAYHLEAAWKISISPTSGHQWLGSGNTATTNHNT